MKKKIAVILCAVLMSPAIGFAGLMTPLMAPVMTPVMGLNQPGNSDLKAFRNERLFNNFRNERLFNDIRNERLFNNLRNERFFIKDQRFFRDDRNR